MSKFFNLFLLLALLLGGILGSVSFPFVHRLAQVVSDLFLNIFKLISLPMIFFAIISTLTQIKSLRKTTLLLRKIFKYTLTTTFIAATVGLLLFLSVRPMIKVPPTTAPPPILEHYSSFLMQIIPQNIIQPFLANNILGVAFIATLLSVSIIRLPEQQGEILRNFFRALFDALLKGVEILVLIMPIGIFAFTILFVERLIEERAQIQHLLFYGGCVIGANLVQGFIILPLILKLKGHSSKQIARCMMPALTMAFFSKSSTVTLPLTLDCAKNRLGLSDKLANFSFPLCSVINMNGCAAFILITVLFVCTSYGVTFTLWEMVPWIFLSTIAAIGNVGVPMGCFFLTMAFLMGMGVPLEIMGAIFPLYSLFDMVETTLNVWSDICITTMVDKEMRLHASR